MSAKIYAKFKNLDNVQCVTGNVYSYQSLSKISKNFAKQQKSWNYYLRYYEYTRENTKISH